MSRFRFAAISTLGLAACGHAYLRHGISSAPSAPPVAARELTAQEQVVHVLSRLTFWARAGDAERVSAMGVDQWIGEQLHPRSITRRARFA